MKQFLLSLENELFYLVSSRYQKEIFIEVVRWKWVFFLLKSIENNEPIKFQVIWMKMNSSSVLTMENRAINTDPRISLLRAYADDWSLQIDDIDEDDAGIYRCFVNNGMFKSVTLDVKGKWSWISRLKERIDWIEVPPKIIDELTTEAYPSAIESGSNLTIKCYAQGKPQPTIRIISYDQFDNAKGKSIDQGSIEIEQKIIFFSD